LNAPRPTATRALFALCACGSLVAAGCGEAPRGGDTGGETALAIPAPPATIAAHPPLATLREELRLDAEAEDFSVVRGVAVDAEGRMAIPLPQDREIRVYDAQGAPLGSLGRRGEGPGEFQGLDVVGWKADTVYAIDWSTARATYAGADGTLLRMEPIPMPMRLVRDDGPPLELFRTLAVAPLADGALLASAWSADPSVPSPFYVRVSPDGSARWVAQAMPGGAGDPRWNLVSGGFSRPVPFALTPKVAISRDGARLGVVSGELGADGGGLVTVSVATTAGETLYTRVYPFEGEAVTAAERDSVLATILAAPTEGGARSRNRDFHAQARERMWPVHAPVTALHLGLDGTAWLALRATDEGQPMLVLDPAGTPLGSVLLPSRATLREASATRIWVAQADELGLASVVRYRVEGLRSSGERAAEP
jgi:hypothetical protein